VEELRLGRLGSKFSGGVTGGVPGGTVLVVVLVGPSVAGGDTSNERLRLLSLLNLSEGTMALSSGAFTAPTSPSTSPSTEP